LPDAPEGLKPPPVAFVNTKFEKKAEIEHIFRVPEKRPGAELSYAFLVLALLPFVAFVVGVKLLHDYVSFKDFFQVIDLCSVSSFYRMMCTVVVEVLLVIFLVSF
jgi:hypothetical protein